MFVGLNFGAGLLQGDLPSISGAEAEARQPNRRLDELKARFGTENGTRLFRVAEGILRDNPGLLTQYDAFSDDEKLILEEFAKTVAD